MKTILRALSVLLASCGSAFAAPAIDFTGLGPTAAQMSAFNAAQNDTTSFGGVSIAGFTYGGGTTFSTGSGYLWLRNDPEDLGLGYCSEGSNCGTTSTLGNGDWNELSNNYKDEIIRLTLPTGKVWTDIFVSSLDAGGSGNNETGTLYWSDVANPNLNTLTTKAIFSHNQIDPPGGAEVVEGSIWSQLSGIDVDAKYLFFRAGPNPLGTNNDYLVWGVSLANPIPEPQTYAMLLAGLLVLGWGAARSRRSQR